MTKLTAAAQKKNRKMIVESKYLVVNINCYQFIIIINHHHVQSM